MTASNVELDAGAGGLIDPTVVFTLDNVAVVAAAADVATSTVRAARLDSILEPICRSLTREQATQLANLIPDPEVQSRLALLATKAGQAQVANLAQNADDSLSLASELAAILQAKAKAMLSTNGSPRSIREYMLSDVERKQTEDLAWGMIAPEVQQHAGKLVLVKDRQVIAVGLYPDAMLSN
ncbi:MAG: hypothetical protein HY246_11365, partial [Proteobacteria bacterium]|nr:hypothetical protein [Pseudomonadota bacterium]